MPYPHSRGYNKTWETHLQSQHMAKLGVGSQQTESPQEKPQATSQSTGAACPIWGQGVDNFTFWLKKSFFLQELRCLGMFHMKSSNYISINNQTQKSHGH